MLVNCIWGFVRLPPEEEATVDPEHLEFLGIKSENKVERRDLSPLTEDLTVFRRNIPAPAELRPVLGRKISVSLPKSAFGKRTISYLSYEIGAEGIRAKSKIAKGVKNLPARTTFKSVQSFLGSLNYCNKFT
ncbi:reverse transcriptase [Phytophthora megakarya]|uniref:Reverse transcriptase n=1 Tax=Phytophthora megakarya TaxID=4795 RepID=A0A225V9I7_9STRA|nr:reverse transcriptase [Phytophthora megakarya]